MQTSVRRRPGGKAAVLWCHEPIDDTCCSVLQLPYSRITLAPSAACTVHIHVVLGVPNCSWNQAQLLPGAASLASRPVAYFPSP